MSSVRAVTRALDILDALAEGPLSTGEIARRIGLPKTTTHRLLATLENRGCVFRPHPTAELQLGPHLLHLAMRVRVVTDLREAAMPVMRCLRDQFGETVNLNLLVGNERLCVASIEGIHEVRSVGVVGQRSPLHSGAAARAILAFLPDERIQDYLAEVPLVRMTDNTITDPARLWEAVRETRRLGYVVTTGERNPGATSVGAPVRNASGEVIGSINITGPTTRMIAYAADALSGAVVGSGASVSRALGYVQSSNKRAIPRGGGM